MKTFISYIHSFVRNVGRTRHPQPVHLEGAVNGTHKEYPRMRRIALPAPEALLFPLTTALHTRASFFECKTNRGLSLQELGTLLGSALGTHDPIRRNYPSGGALYPIETYLIGPVLEKHPSGVFHYHPKAHALEFLWETPPSFTTEQVLHGTDTPRAPMLIVFTSVWDRSSIKYGDLAYAHGLIEAGHMAENILLMGTALSLGMRPIAGFDDVMLQTLIDLPEGIEQPVYAILLCGS